MSRSKQRRGSFGRGSGRGGGEQGARRLPPSLTAEDLSDDRRQILAKIHRHQAIKAAHASSGGGGNDDQSTMYDPSVYEPSVYTGYTEGVNSAHTDTSGGTAGSYNAGGGGGGGTAGRRSSARRRNSGDPDPEGVESVVSALESFMMKAPWARRGGSRGGAGADGRTVASAMTYGTNQSGSTGSGSFQPRLPAVARAAAVGNVGGRPSSPGVTEDYALRGSGPGGGGPQTARRGSAATTSSAADLENPQLPAEEFITLKKLRVRKFLSVLYLLVSAAVVFSFGFFMVGQKMTLYSAWPTEGVAAEGKAAEQAAQEGEKVAGAGAASEPGALPAGEATPNSLEASGGGDAGSGGKVSLGESPGLVQSSPGDNAHMRQSGGGLRT